MALFLLSIVFCSNFDVVEEKENTKKRRRIKGDVEGEGELSDDFGRPVVARGCCSNSVVINWVKKYIFTKPTKPKQIELG